MPLYSIELRGKFTRDVQWIALDAKDLAEAQSKAMLQADITYTVEAIDEIHNHHDHIDALQHELDELKCGHKVVKPSIGQQRWIQL